MINPILTGLEVLGYRDQQANSDKLYFAASVLFTRENTVARNLMLSLADTTAFPVNVVFTGYGRRQSIESMVTAALVSGARERLMTTGYAQILSSLASVLVNWGRPSSVTQVSNSRISLSSASGIMESKERKGYRSVMDRHPWSVASDAMLRFTSAVAATYSGNPEISQYVRDGVFTRVPALVRILSEIYREGSLPPPPFGFDYQEPRAPTFPNRTILPVTIPTTTDFMVSEAPKEPELRAYQIKRKRILG